MYIATNEAVTPRHSIINIMPQALKRYMYSINLDEAGEIRLILDKPVFIRYPDGDYYITEKGVLCRDSKNGVVIRRKHMEELLEKITKSSLYSVKDEIKNGYITIDNGHRIGICGTAVMTDDKVEFIKDISSMNIRLAGEFIGISDALMGDIICDGIKNTIIISSPGCGKTTLLRDIIRNISDRGYCVGVADERCEIASMKNGISGFNLGGHTSVLDNCPKTYAMTTLLRSMAPDVIATDELGTDSDVEAVLKIINSGVSIIATAHSRDIKQLTDRDVFKRLLPIFDIAVVLSKREGVGTIEKVEVT